MTVPLTVLGGVSIGLSVAHQGPPTDNQGLSFVSGLVTVLPAAILWLVVLGLFLGSLRRYHDHTTVWRVMTAVWRSGVVCLRCNGVFFPPNTPYTVPGELTPIERFPAAVTEIAARVVRDARST